MLAAPPPRRRLAAATDTPANYKWIVLSNTTIGMILAAISFILLEQLPVNFSYIAFAALLLLNGIGMCLFASPNRAGS